MARSDNRAVRWNAFIARAGVASRRKADELIKADRVQVNGEPGRLNTFVSPGDVVELDGRRLAEQRLAYVLLNKPGGVVTTARDPRGRPTVVGLVHHEARVVPVGRLDADTTGAPLLTNDGELAHRPAHPRYRIAKVSEAEVEGAASARRGATGGGPRRSGGEGGDLRLPGATGGGPGRPGPGHVALNARVPRGAEAGLDRLGLLARGDRDDVDQVRDPGLVGRAH